MKITLIAVLAFSLMMTGCETTQNGSQPEEVSEKPEAPPELGMTKEQAIAQYGETDNIMRSSKGEVWTYHVNPGEAFIPFNFGYRPKFRILTFDAEGKLIEWSDSK